MNCAFLMSSCDSYEDTWDPFFLLLSKYWPGIPFRVYLNTETKQYRPSKLLPFEVVSCNTAKGLPWGKRMRSVLETLPEEYVFHVLDDFFLQDSVQTAPLLKLLELLEGDPSIASFQLKASRIAQDGEDFFVVKDDKHREIQPFPDSPLRLVELEGADWKTCFNPTLWRKSVFLRWLRQHESVWGFELYGSQRARFWKYPEKVYYVNAPMIYDYLWVKNCSVIVNGKWLNEPAVDEFFAKNGIMVNYASRGRITVEQYRSKTMKDVLKRYTPLQIVQRCFYRVCSFF